MVKSLVLHKILIANRGEIAVRVIRACRDMGLGSVAIYSDCDRAARHVRLADEAVKIGGNAPAESYLRIDRIIDAARAAGADAVHPGYGFLAENAAFAAACHDAGLTFIGPSPAAIELMGSKTAARAAALAAGVPVVPGSKTPIGVAVPDEAVVRIARDIGYPVMVKAVAGGGGKGMRVVSGDHELPGAVRAARSEAAASFGDAAIYLERRIVRPRHIEVQLLGDHHGTVVPFVERECSIQRRHQKLVEEAPSPAVSPELRARMTSAAAAVAGSVGYTNAGTIEFLVEGARFYFLEMNTRLQVEHPVTEMVTGVDLVQWQIRIARGERLALDPAHLLRPHGHALECRIYAEDPDNAFLPSPGRIHEMRVPHGPGIRDDSGVEPGDEVPIFYDSLVSKLVAWGADRQAAIRRMARALREYEVFGIRTTVPFFRWLVRQADFHEGAFHTSYLDEVLQRRAGEPFSSVDPSLEEVAVIAAALEIASETPAVVPSHDGRGAWPQAHAAGHPDQPTRIGASEPSGRSPTAGEGGWRRQARLEGLR